MSINVGDILWYNVTEERGCNIEILEDKGSFYIIRLKNDDATFKLPKEVSYKLKKERKEKVRRPPKRTTNYNGIRRKKTIDYETS